MLLKSRDSMNSNIDNLTESTVSYRMRETMEKKKPFFNTRQTHPNFESMMWITVNVGRWISQIHLTGLSVVHCIMTGREPFSSRSIFMYQPKLKTVPQKAATPEITNRVKDGEQKKPEESKTYYKKRSDILMCKR